MGGPTNRLRCNAETIPEVGGRNVKLGGGICTFCPSPRWILEITRLVAQMANTAGLLALVVAEIFDWLADMLVMGGYALEVSLATVQDCGDVRLSAWEALRH